MLGDVFAWNKVFRRSFWDRERLAWPAGLRYEDQPVTTTALLAGTFDVLTDVVYHWRLRDDATSVTQQRTSERDLQDRITTKRMSLAAVREHGDAAIETMFVRRVLAGDLHNYFAVIPGCSDAWWQLLRDGLRELWDGGDALMDSMLPPAQRLIAWLVLQDRRQDAAAVTAYVADLGRPLYRRAGPVAGQRQVWLPPTVLDLGTVDAVAITLRPDER